MDDSLPQLRLSLCRGFRFRRRSLFSRFPPRGVSAAASGRRAGADALLHSIALSVVASGGSSSPGGRDGCSMGKRGPFSVHRELCLAATLCATMSMGCSKFSKRSRMPPVLTCSGWCSRSRSRVLPRRIISMGSGLPSQHSAVAGAQR